jgi:uncharacterized protein YbjT (DUF2867 family)
MSLMDERHSGPADPRRNVELAALVTGATGMQGGAVARAMSRAGLRLTALVRTPDAASAQALAQDGIDLVVGDLEDADSLASACIGQTAVFSVQQAPSPRDPDAERRQARNLITAARQGGVHHLLHTSVSGTGWRLRHPGVDPGATRGYWDSKEDVEMMVRDAGFPAYTIVKPAFFMENFIAPKAAGMFPLLADGELLVATGPDTPVALIAASDFGSVVAAIATAAERFAGAEIELGADQATFPQIARVFTEVTGRTIASSCRPAAEVDALLGGRSWSATQTWLDEVGYPARPEHAAAHGLRLTTGLRQWAETHRIALQAATTPKDPRP